MFYNDFILVFIEKYQQKYQQNILLPTKKPIFADNQHQDYVKIGGNITVRVIKFSAFIR